MNIKDYNAVYTSLRLNKNISNSIDDVIRLCNISCYEAAKQAIFDYNHNRLLIKTGEDDYKSLSPDEWLSSGTYVGLILSRRHPGFLENFINENSDFLSNVEVVRFLGSGQVGDAWELKDNKILKIFDNSIQNDLTKYEKVREITDNEESYSGYDVKIYSLGKLNLPEQYRGTKTPSFSAIRMHNEDKPEYDPAYVILEKLTTYSDIVKSYGESEGGLSELPEVLKKVGMPQDSNFQDALGFNPDPEYAVDLFMTYIGDIIIQGSIRGWYDDTLSHYSGRSYPMDLDSVLSQRSDLPFLNRRQRISALADMYIDELSLNPNLPEPKFFNAYVSILKSAKPNLPDDWLLKLAESTISKLELGHKDVHTGNVGIRGEGDLSFVYYDS